VSRLLLAIDLLEAKDFCIEPQELRPHEGDALVECRFLAGFVVEVFEVKGCFAEFVGHRYLPHVVN